MKRVVFLFALAMLGFVASSHAQTDLPGSCSAFYPEVLAKKAVIGVTDANAISKGNYGQTPKPASPKHWVVYSDREDNVTYTKPDGSVKPQRTGSYCQDSEWLRLGLYRAYGRYRLSKDLS